MQIVVERRDGKILVSKLEEMRLIGGRRRGWKDTVEKRDGRVWTGSISLD
jgi:hypothetical protein